MEVYKKIGTKGRLVEMFQNVNKIRLTEQTLSREERNKIIKDFVNFIKTKVKFEGDLPKILITYNEDEAKDSKSFGRYTPHDSEIKVVGINRNLADILRTLGHELIHHSQNLKGELDINSGEDGSEQENEANSLAGVIMREFGKENPIIFE